jgi:hypothetical protein
MATMTAAMSGMPMASGTTMPERSTAPIQALPGRVGWLAVRLSRAASAKPERTKRPAEHGGCNYADNQPWSNRTGRYVAGRRRPETQGDQEDMDSRNGRG